MHSHCARNTYLSHFHIFPLEERWEAWNAWTQRQDLHFTPRPLKLVLGTWDLCFPRKWDQTFQASSFGAQLELVHQIQVVFNRATLSMGTCTLPPGFLWQTLSPSTLYYRLWVHLNFTYACDCQQIQRTPMNRLLAFRVVLILPRKGKHGCRYIYIRILIYIIWPCRGQWTLTGKQPRWFLACWFIPFCSTSFLCEMYCQLLSMDIDFIYDCWNPKRTSGIDKPVGIPKEPFCYCLMGSSILQNAPAPLNTTRRQESHVLKLSFRCHIRF